MKRYTVPLCTALASLLWAGLAGCGSAPADPGPLTDEPAFAAIPRDPEHGALVASLRQKLDVNAAPDVREPGAGNDFYLAIHKRELSQKYFLSSFLRLYYAEGTSARNTVSVGTRVVTLRASNNRLFIVRADDGQATSDTFTPDALILEAFPIIADYAPFKTLPGSKNYVLVDPAAGLSRMTLLLSDAFGGARFERDLSYLRNFRPVADGVTYENVVAGSANVLLSDNGFRATATLGVGLRRYSEGAGFVPYEPDPMDPSYFFLSGAQLVSNTGQTRNFGAKFNIADPAKTIEWVISPFFPAKYVPAVKAGIESWNAVFGRAVFKARVANAGEDAGQDDKNYILYDGDPSLGVAYANWRTNPNTGETRGAFVYINRAWIDGAERFTDDPMMARGAAEGQAKPHVLPRLQWDGVTDPPLCELWADDPRLLPEVGDASLTAAEKGQRYIQHVIAHEIGHDIGLRHNFKGSQKWSAAVPGSTVMDYQSAAERILLNQPGSYDTAAVKLLYGLSTDKPADPFCTDNGVGSDPECQQFDSRADPLNEHWRPVYEGFVNDYLSGASPTAPNNSLNNVLMFVRGARTSAQRVAAWNLASSKVAVAAPVPMPTPMGYGARRDFLGRRMLQRLWLDDASLRGPITVDPPLDPALLALWLPELRGNLLNGDGFRTYATRRVAVDVLKKLQLTPAQTILRDARTTLAGELPMLSGDAVLQHRDVLSRIDAALSPYFIN